MWYHLTPPPPPPPPLNAAYMHQWTGSALVQVMACHLLGAKPLPEPMVSYCQLDFWEYIKWNSNQNSIMLTQENAFENVVCQKVGHFVLGEMSWCTERPTLADALPPHINSSFPAQNCCHFTDVIFRCIFLNENVWISIRISLNFVPTISMNNIQVMVQIMAWRRIGDKPLSEAMLTRFTDTYMQH